MTNREGVGESRLIRLVRKWRLPLLLLLTGLVAVDIRGAMGIAAPLAANETPIPTSADTCPA